MTEKALKTDSSSTMTDKPSNIVLIGMPGSGKSTVGVILAKLTGRDFVDTDVLIQKDQGRTLQDIVDKDGYLILREIEEKTILKLECRNHIVATGGSAVYSQAAMEHLKSNGIAVFLNVDMQTLFMRVQDFDTRGLAKRPDQGVSDLFSERHGLYRKYADVIIDCEGLNHEAICAKIVSEVEARK
jgi:shikimate kinase